MRSFRLSRPRAVLAMALLALSALAAHGQVRRSLRLIPGTPAEAAALVNEGNLSSVAQSSGDAAETAALRTVADGVRVAGAGGRWTYRLPALPGSACRLVCRTPPSTRLPGEGEGEAPLRVTVTGADGKPLPVTRQALPDGFVVTVRAPAAHPLGGHLSFRFQAGNAGAALREAEYSMTAPDANGNGVADSLDAALSPARAPARAPRPSRPMTSFQTGRPYRPDLAVTADAVLVYSSAPDVLQSWAEAGYTVYAMGGFREPEAYLKERPGEVQTDREGRRIAIGGSSYYMVPTAERNKRSVAHYLQAVSSGARGVCPEEPEIFARAGYSEAFKAEWQAEYGMPWTPPHSDIAGRYRSEQLKAKLTVRQIDAILGAVAQRSPGVRRMLAVHSPITYSHWGIVMPHHALFQLPSVQEVIGQVWTGTARTPNRMAGVRSERTFHLAYLEYSSLVCLLRGLGKPLWMLMDPVEDNPNRTLDDYRRNYAETLAASFMFPTADRFEVMPWPSRIYGRVPPEYATVVNSVVGALSDCWRYPARVTAGAQGIAMLTADSMALQRADPAPSDFDGVYGLSLPLINHGIPLDALSLDRCADSRYLTGTKVLLGSYDFLKPASAASNAGLADWVKRGGVLMMHGGTDAYDALPTSWWRAAGHATPLDDLFKQLGIETRRLASGGLTPVPKTPANELARGDGAERNLRNRRRYTLDLTPYTRQSGSVGVRFEDVTPDDGWGPAVSSVELRIRDRLAASFRAGSEMETRFLAVDSGSALADLGRFADGRAYWEYRFDNLPRDAQIGLIVEMGNGFLVSAYVPPARAASLECLDPDVHPTLRRIRTVGGYELTSYAPPPGASVLYRRVSDGLPAVWVVKVGAGTLIFCGMPPGFLTVSAQTDRWMRDLVRRGCAAAGMALETANAFVAARGPYVAARALIRPETLSGNYVDLLSPDLKLVQDPEIAAGEVAFMKDVSGVSGPGLLAASGRLDAALDGSTVTAFTVRGPEGSPGAARLATGSRTPAGVKAWDAWGRPVAVNASPGPGSVLLRYANRADGVAVRVAWK